MFWSSKTLKDRLSRLVSGTDPKAIKQGSVELRLGHQATISGDGLPRVTELSEHQALNIPSYQTLLTLNWTLLATTLGLFITIVGVMLAQLFADPKPTEVKIQLSDPARLLVSPSNSAPSPFVLKPSAAPVQLPAKADGKAP